MVIIGFILSHQLLPLESHLDIEHAQQNSYSQHDYIQLRLSFLSDEITPTDWGFITYREIMFLDSIKDCFEIEQKTILQNILLFGLIYEEFE